MSFIEIFLIGVGLSMDAFAVSVGKGLSIKRTDKTYLLTIAGYFGAFQAVMPLLGYFLGETFAKKIERFGPYLAFILLLFIGLKMIIDGIKDKINEGKEKEVANFNINQGEMFLLAVATSIDAFMVGVSFSFFDVNIYYSVVIIGLTTFVLTIAGVFIGKFFGERYKLFSSILGGVILILIGIKVLI